VGLAADPGDLGKVQPPVSVEESVLAPVGPGSPVVHGSESTDPDAAAAERAL
jgi:hypothetical protein